MMIPKNRHSSGTSWLIDPAFDEVRERRTILRRFAPGLGENDGG